MNVTIYPDYDNTVDLFGDFANICHPSYVHGVICSYLCFNISFNPEDWLSSLIEQDYTLKSMEKVELEPILDIIKNLFNTSEALLSAAEFEFDLFLPDECEELSYRTIALSGWCQGFIEVYSMVKQDLKLSMESQEVVDYIIETAGVDIEYGTSDAEQKAFVEICEFIRLASLMLFMELRKNITEQECVIH